MIPVPADPVEPEDESLTLEIMKLPAKLKEVALLCWFQGMTYNEAAETLGISLQAVGSRLNRARRKLRSVMEGSEVHEPA
jgi:RNA polymerase sigma-70 factor (ECF subfamily)